MRCGHAQGAADQVDVSTPAVWLLDGAGESVFEVVEELFDDSVVGGNYDGAESDPVLQCAFEVEGVTDQGSRISGDRFEDVPAVDGASMHGVKGEFDEPAGKIGRACVADVAVSALCSLGRWVVQNHWAPIGSGPQDVFWRSESSQ